MLIAKGAEANLSREKIDEEEILVKDRIKKGYRVPALDENIRMQRTQQEARLIREAARVGVSTPKVLEAKGSVLKIEFIDGKKVKDILSKENCREICGKIGRAVARLHSYDIIHGDLTTSNMILKDNELFFIDFGLGFFSKSIEDKATDLHLFLEALKSTHFDFSEEAFAVFLKEYEKSYDKASSVAERLKQIELRGRYVKR